MVGDTTWVSKVVFIMKNAKFKKIPKAWDLILIIEVTVVYYQCLD
jgi:hypothetical protein